MEKMQTFPVGKDLKTGTSYLASSGFKEMCEAAIQPSRNLYPDKNGVPSAQTKAIMDAYTSVGVN
ncbi:hypothetical protein [Gottfriedia acidiceleris]|uniref:hypothetical protein n=1 Tax=Gottfriedia acidiceleris TaxID=371036 RepID=UPI000B452986|nr:hypothetical protein [Gottfriedia acidiceleris]